MQPEICISCVKAGFCEVQRDFHDAGIKVCYCGIYQYDPPEKDSLDWVDQFKPFWTNPVFKRGRVM